MKTCPDCGERVYNLGCVNCNEEAYIEEQVRLDERWGEDDPWPAKSKDKPLPSKPGVAARG